MLGIDAPVTNQRDTKGASMAENSRPRARNKSRLPVIVMFAISVNGTAAAADALSDVAARKLLNARSCNACHGIDEVRLGPSFRAVALRYAAAPESSVDWLAQKIIVGGAGSWGFVPMISNPGVSPAEARAIADWILTLQERIPAS
jgi:cytochrome c